MDVRKRIQLCRLIEKMGKNREFSKKLGIRDVSEFAEATITTWRKE